ncbi:hypothetical protein B4107_1925 [Bacillus safensis]|nr:hypothetical protein B4107_1925 [Bacillus safensis]
MLGLFYLLQILFLHTFFLLSPLYNFTLSPFSRMKALY